MKRAPVLVVFLALAFGSTGSAGTPPLVPAGSSPFDVGDPSGQVLLADVDRDGRLDLLTRHQQARAIKLHLGDGRAGFSTTDAPVGLGFPPSDMAVGDVDGDRIVDIVVTAGARDVVDVLLGTADASFRRARGSPFTASTRRYRYNKRSLHLVDLDRDGHLDIVTVNRRGQYAFRVLRGKGNGRFAAGPVLRVAPVQEGYTLAFGDVDGDRDVDVVSAVSHPESGRLDVYLNDGRRFRWKPDARLRLPATYELEALGDMNSDRRPDLVLSHRDARVSVLLNRGGGRFAPAAGSPFALASRPFSVVAADLDGDDQIDLVGATEDSVSVLLGDRGAYPRARQSTFRAEPGAFDLAVGDVSGDGRPDVVASSFGSDAVTVLVGR